MAESTGQQRIQDNAQNSDKYADGRQSQPNHTGRTLAVTAGKVICHKLYYTCAYAKVSDRPAAVVASTSDQMPISLIDRRLAKKRYNSKTINAETNA